MTILEFITLVGLGASVREFDVGDPCIQWVLIGLADGRRLLVVEQTLREATVIMEPTEADLARCRENPWGVAHLPSADPEAIVKLARERV